jgi:hypothetical protein
MGAHRHPLHWPPSNGDRAPPTAQSRRAQDQSCKAVPEIGRVEPGTGSPLVPCRLGTCQRGVRGFVPPVNLLRWARRWKRPGGPPGRRAVLRLHGPYSGLWGRPAPSPSAGRRRRFPRSPRRSAGSPSLSPGGRRRSPSPSRARRRFLSSSASASSVPSARARAACATPPAAPHLRPPELLKRVQPVGGRHLRVIERDDVLEHRPALLPLYRPSASTASSRRLICEPSPPSASRAAHSARAAGVSPYSPSQRSSRPERRLRTSIRERTWPLRFSTRPSVSAASTRSSRTMRAPISSAPMRSSGMVCGAASSSASRSRPRAGRAHGGRCRRRVAPGCGCPDAQLRGLTGGRRRSSGT